MSMQQLPAPSQPAPQKTYMERILEGRVMKKMLRSKEGWRSRGVLVVGALLLVAEMYFLVAVYNVLSTSDVAMMIAMIGSAINALSAWLVFRAKLFDIPEDTDQSTIAFVFLIGDALIIAMNTWLATVITMSGNSLDEVLRGNLLLSFWHQACTSVPIILHFIGWPLLLMTDPEKIRRDARIKAEQDKQDAELNHEQMEHTAYMEAQKLQLRLEEDAKKAELARREIEQKAELARLSQELQADIDRKEQEHKIAMEKLAAELARDKMTNEMKHQTEMLKIEEETELNKSVSDLRRDVLKIKAQRVRERIEQVVPYLDEDVDELVRQAYEKMTGKSLPISIKARQIIVDSKPKPKITAKLPTEKEVQLSTDHSQNNSGANPAGGQPSTQTSEILPPNMDLPDPDSNIRRFPDREPLPRGRGRNTKNGKTIEAEQRQAAQANPIRKRMSGR